MSYVTEKQPGSVHLDWVDLGNEEQVRWAQNYLRKKGVSSTLSNDEPRVLIAFEHDGVDGLDRKMRYAWAQQKRRKESNLKPYSFFMKEGVGPALHRLAIRKERPISWALEALILEDKDLAAEYDAQLKASMRQYREEYERRGMARLKNLTVRRLDQQIKQSNRDLKHLKRTSEEQWQVIEQLLHRLAVYELSGDAGRPPELGDDRASELTRRKEELLNFYKSEIESKASYPEAGELPAD